MAGDPYWNNVVLAMHMDGTDGSTTFTDVKGHAVVVYGNARLGTAQSKFGGSSLLCDGTADRLSLTHADCAVGTGDFTIECFVRLLAKSGDQHIINMPNGASFLQIGFNGTTFFIYSNLGYNGFAGYAVNTWYHVAVQRASGSVKVFIDGVLVNTQAMTTNFYTGTIVIGGSTASDTDSLNGNIDEFRLTKGVARYAGNFTAPDSAFPDRGLRISGTVKDSTGEFSGRIVRAYRHSDGALAGAAVSNATTGVFMIEGMDTTPHYVVCIPPTSTENALILDNITPL